MYKEGDIIPADRSVPELLVVSQLRIPPDYWVKFQTAWAVTRRERQTSGELGPWKSYDTPPSPDQWRRITNGSPSGAISKNDYLKARDTEYLVVIPIDQANPEWGEVSP